MPGTSAYQSTVDLTPDYATRCEGHPFQPHPLV